MATDSWKILPYRSNEHQNCNALDKLDEAFLFTIGFVGLIFTIIQVYQNSDIASFAQISPLLVLGIVLPFYVGYIRGAIYNSLIERLRGWIYLVVGVSAYCALITITSESGLLSFSFFIFIFLAIASIGYIEQWFKHTFKFEETAQNMFSLSGTVVSSFVLAYGFVFITKLVASSDLSLQLLHVVVIYVCIVIALMSEKLSRQAQFANLESAYGRALKETEIGYKKFKFFQLVMRLSTRLAAYGVRDIFTNSKSLIILMFACFLVGSFVLENSQNPYVQWIPVAVSGSLILVAVICFSIVAFFFLRKEKVDLG